MGYRHLTEGERYQIEGLCAAGKSFSEIARQLSRSKSTIGREVGRHSFRGRYKAEEAQRCCREKLLLKGCIRQRWHLMFDEAGVKLLAEGWSPEQISGVFSGSALSVSHEWLYQRILRDKEMGGTVYRHLRCQKQRRKRYGRPERRGQIANRRGLDERPTVVEERRRFCEDLSPPNKKQIEH